MFRYGLPRSSLLRVSLPFALVVALSAPAQADTVGDSVGDHLESGLKKNKKKRGAKKPKRGERSSPKKPGRDAHRTKRDICDQPRREGDDDGLFSFSTCDEEAETGEKKKPKGPRPPFRVFGPNFKLDPKLGGGYRGWYAQQYPTVSVDSQGYFTWSLEAKGRFFRLINLHRG